MLQLSFLLIRLVKNIYQALIVLLDLVGVVSQMVNVQNYQLKLHVFKILMEILVIGIQKNKSVEQKYVHELQNHSRHKNNVNNFYKVVN